MGLYQFRTESAWTCCDYADFLLQRNEPGDRERAMSLLEESLGHLQRAGHAAPNGAGAVPAGDSEGVAHTRKVYQPYPVLLNVSKPDLIGVTDVMLHVMILFHFLEVAMQQFLDLTTLSRVGLYQFRTESAYLLRLRRFSAPAKRTRRPREGHVVAGGVVGHLQRAGHAAPNGAGAVPAGDSEGVAHTRNLLILPNRV